MMVTEKQTRKAIMTHVIKVLEPGRKKSKLYAGNGYLTNGYMFAKQYQQNAQELRAWCSELEQQNPGCKFTPFDITGTGADLYREERLTK